MPSESKVGVTPWSREIERVDGAGVFALKKPGFADARVEIDLRISGSAHVALAPVKAADKPTTSITRTVRPKPETSPSTHSNQPHGRNRGEPVNPFTLQAAP